MKNHRLFEIIYLLLEKQTITAKELAEHFETSTRTIYRDIDILSSAGIPIYMNKGKNGGICLLESYKLDKSLLSDEEQNQILFALQSLEKLTAHNEHKALEKMSMLFCKDTKNWIEVDLSNWEENNVQNVVFYLLKEAILKKQVIEFVYFNSNGIESKRKVEPLQICFKDKAWYVKGYCHSKKDYRLFKMARIKGITILEEHFDRELPKEIKAKQTTKMITLKLKIHQEMAYRVYDEFEADKIKKNEEGDFLIEVSYPENDWVYSYILSFEDKIEILEPQYARQIIKEKIEKMIKKYL